MKNKQVKARIVATTLAADAPPFGTRIEQEGMSSNAARR
jgi:hypothetical protein